MSRDLFTNQGVTTVSSGGTTAPASGTQEAWTVASSATFPEASSTDNPPSWFYVVDVAATSEIIKVINVSGTTWTVLRGAEGTTPVAHTGGFTVQNVVTAGWLTKVDDRLCKDEYNVLDFGALGDDANNDHTGIQAALDAARDNNGGIVRIPKGNYRLATYPLKVYQGTHIIAHPQAHIKNYANTSSMVWNGTGGDTFNGYEGNGNIVIEGGIWDQRAGTWLDGAACFSFAHGRNITFQNLTIRDVADTHAIEINGCQGVRILNCRFEGFYATAGREYSEAIQLDLMKSSAVYGAFGNYDNTPCDDVIVDGCVFTESDDPTTHKWGRGVGSHNGTIGKWHTNIRIVNNWFSVNHEAVRGYSWNKTVVSNNILANCGSGIELRSIPYNGTPSEDTKDASGVQQNTSQDFQDFTITGNTISGTEATSTPLPGIYILGESTGQARNGTITGNTLTSVGDDAISVNYGNQMNISSNTIVNGGNYGILVQFGFDSVIANNNIDTTDWHAIAVFTGNNNLISGNNIGYAGQRAIYVSGDDDTVVQGNYIFGASRLNGTGTEAMLGDGTPVPVSWINNTVRKVGSGNDYTYALKTSNGTHYIRGNDFEIGTTGRLSLAGTIEGMTSITLNQPGAMGGTGDEVAMEWVAPTSGYIKRFVARLASGDANFRPNVNDATPTGAVNTAVSSTLGGANQTIEYAANDRIGVEQTSAGTSPTSLMVTFWVIENGSNL